MPEVQETIDDQRNRITAEMLAQELANSQWAYQGHSPASFADPLGGQGYTMVADPGWGGGALPSYGGKGGAEDTGKEQGPTSPAPGTPSGWSGFASLNSPTPGWDASMANVTDMIAPESNAVAQSLADMNAADKAAAQAAAQNNMADFATAGALPSGNLFSGTFDMFGNAYDPGAPAPGSPSSITDMSVAPAPGFGPNATTPSTNPTDFSPGSSFDLGALGDPGAMASAIAADTAAAQGGGFGGGGDFGGGFGGGSSTSGDNSGSEGASGGVG